MTSTHPDLFNQDVNPPTRETLGDGAMILRGFALPDAASLIAGVDMVARDAAFRHLVTPGGFTMSVAMTNCGPLGWVSDRRGYRYAPLDPASGKPWPMMPPSFLTLAREAAAEAGYDGFVPDACLINNYEPGARLTLHQDKDELDLEAPIVSVSLGLPAKFLFGGLARADRPQRIMLHHGDVCVWGGPSRLCYHGIDVLKDGDHPLTGRRRINLTFRKTQ